MIEVKKVGVLLEKTIHGFENEGVLNPAAILVDGTIHLFYRAVSKGNYSSIGCCTLKDPLVIDYRSEIPLLFPQFDYEMHGVEDPRIVKIDELFYLTYTAYDGVNALGALATSKDLVHWEKKGLIVPQITFKEFERLSSSKTVLNNKYNRYNVTGGAYADFQRIDTMIVGNHLIGHRHIAKGQALHRTANLLLNQATHLQHARAYAFKLSVKFFRNVFVSHSTFQ